MKESRLKKATYNVIVLTFYQIVVFASNLILPRFILLQYGSEYNGIVSSITQFLNIISILRIGVAGATRVELYKSLGKEDNKKTSEIIKATEIFMRKIAMIFLLYLLCLSVIYPLMINTSYEWFNVFSLVIIIGLGVFAEYFFGITYQTLLTSDQKLYIYNFIQIATTILNTIISCILIKLNFPIQIVKLGSAIIFTISPIILNLYVSKTYKLDKKAKPDNTALKNRKDVVAHSVANIIHENTDVTLLTLFCDVKIVSVYTVYNLVILGLKQLFSTFTSGMEAAFGNMWVKNEKEKMNSSLGLYEFFICVFISVIFSCALYLIIPFIRLYTKNVNDVEYILPGYAILALITQAFWCLRSPYLMITQAAGKYKETRNGAFLEAFLNFTISIILVKFIGLYGATIGTLVANVFRTTQFYLFVNKNLIIRKKAILIKLILWTVLNIGISIICIELINSILLINIGIWLEWVIMGVLAFIISTIVTILSSLIFYRDKLKGFLNIIKRILVNK